MENRDQVTSKPIELNLRCYEILSLFVHKKLEISMTTSVTKGKEPEESPKMEFVSFFLEKKYFLKLGPVTFVTYLPTKKKNLMSTSKILKKY